jgi:putative membrane protein
MRSESTFGGYYYTEVLNGPLVFGVPPITMIDYFALGYPAYIIARVIAGNENRRISVIKSFGVAVLAALTMVTHDLSVDPTQATVRKLWIWEGGGAYFGVPLHNFVDWFFVTLTFLFLYGFVTNSSGAMTFIASKTSRHFYLPPILVYLAFALPVMLGPVLHGETEISLSMSGIAMFASTIPVLAAILALYRDDRPTVGGAANSTEFLGRTA